MIKKGIRWLFRERKIKVANKHTRLSDELDIILHNLTKRTRIAETLCGIILSLNFSVFWFLNYQIVNFLLTQSFFVLFLKNINLSFQFSSMTSLCQVEIS